MNKMISGFVVTVFTCFALVLLSACGNVFSNVAVPDGYSKYQYFYRSSKAPSPPSLDYNFSDLQSEESASYWRMACDDIVSKIVANHGVSQLPVFLANENPRSDLNAIFDNFLREALVDAGFKIAGAMGEVPIMRFDAEKVSPNQARYIDNKMTAITKDGNTLLTITIEGGGRLLAVEKGVYNIVESRR